MKAPMQTIRSFIRPIVAKAIRNAKARRQDDAPSSADGSMDGEQTLLDYLAQLLDGTCVVTLASRSLTFIQKIQRQSKTRSLIYSWQQAIP